MIMEEDMVTHSRNAGGVLGIYGNATHFTNLELISIWVLCWSCDNTKQGQTMQLYGLWLILNLNENNNTKKIWLSHFLFLPLFL